MNLCRFILFIWNTFEKLTGIFWQMITMTRGYRFSIKDTCVPKNIPNIFDCNLKKDYKILIIFATTGHQMTIHFPTSVPVTPPPGKQNQHNITFLSNVLLLFNQNNTQKHFYHIFDILADISFSCPFLTACSQIVQNVFTLHKNRHGDVFSIRWQQYWCSFPVASWIGKHYWTSSGWHTGAWQSNLHCVS